MQSKLSLGPVLFNWSPEQWRDFYFQVADEAPVDTVYIGEVICSKRAPLFEPVLEEVVTRLTEAGKQLIFSTLSETASAVDRRLVERTASADEFFIEANDASALEYLEGKPHAIGPHINTFNEESLEFFAENGAKIISLSPEIPKQGIKELAGFAEKLDIELEVQIYGRMGLALSARCYSARAHNRTKDTCQFICDKDLDGMVIETMEGRPFLAINGIQTMSYSCLNLAGEISELQNMGIPRYRISPHSIGTIETCKTFRDLLDGKTSPEKAVEEMKQNTIDAPFSNGFYHDKSGYDWQQA